MRQLTVILAMFLGWLVFGSVSAAPPAAATASTAGVSQRVTGKQCVECHESESKTHVYHGDCASCHTGAGAHAKAEKPKGVKTGEIGTAQCQACHAKDARRMNFSFAEHNRAGIQCSDCHGIHTPKVKTLNVGMEKAGKHTALCATCHQDVLARLNMPSHHPVKEGGLSCVGCHDPHAGNQVTLMSKNEQCFTCHQRIRGPQAFEHAPVAEDCSNCHNPHGSPNRKLLTLAQPMLCLQCHSLPNNRHGQTGSNATTPTALNQTISGAALRSCTACHSQVHGSSHDEHLRY